MRAGQCPVGRYEYVPSEAGAKWNQGELSPFPLGQGPLPVSQTTRLKAELFPSIEFMRGIQPNGFPRKSKRFYLMRPHRVILNGMSFEQHLSAPVINHHISPQIKGSRFTTHFDEPLLSPPIFSRNHKTLVNEPIQPKQAPISPTKTPKLTEKKDMNFISIHQTSVKPQTIHHRPSILFIPLPTFSPVHFQTPFELYRRRTNMATDKSSLGRIFMRLN